MKATEKKCTQFRCTQKIMEIALKIREMLNKNVF